MLLSPAKNPLCKREIKHEFRILNSNMSPYMYMYISESKLWNYATSGYHDNVA